MARTTCKLHTLQGLCSDGVTQAAKLEVEGPNGAFTWVGGTDQVASLFDFLGNLRQVDPKIMDRLALQVAVNPL